MRQLLLASMILAAACSRSTTKPRAAQPQQMATQMKTIETVEPRPAIVDPPPVLSDEAPPPKPKGMPWETPQAVVLTPEDEKVRAALPFSPAIAMDPVNGDKISIRAKTPVVEYKGKLYYFTNEENKRTFVANPENFTKQGFTKL